MRFLILILTSVGLFGQVTVVGNMSSSNFMGSASVQSTFWIAQMFTTDNQEYEISSVEFRGSRNAGQTLSAYIYADSGGGTTPVTGATGFGVLDASGVTSTLGTQTLTPVGTITLDPNTNYWLVLQPSDVNFTLWQQSTDAGNLDGQASASLPVNRATSGDGGANWSGSTPSTTLMIEINGAQTPVSLQSVSVE